MPVMPIPGSADIQTAGGPPGVWAIQLGERFAIGGQAA